MNFFAVTDSNRKLQVNWDRVNAYVAQWPPGTALDFSLTRRKKKRSEPMRKYYFGVVLPTLLDTLGYERDEAEQVHMMLKCRYFNVQPDKRGVYRLKDIPAVFADDSPLDVTIKKAFTEWVIRKCSEYGGYVPDPGEK